LHADEDVAQSSFLYPAHRMRQVKGASAVTSLYSRGMRNNGVIEIIDDLKGSDDEHANGRTSGGKAAPARSATSGAHGSGCLATTYPNPDTFGRTHRLKASSVALDTLEK
jgi:hypothetical protein